MAKSTTPKGKIKVSFNIPENLLDQLKEKAEVENWSHTTAFTEAIKMLVNTN